MARNVLPQKGILVLLEADIVAPNILRFRNGVTREFPAPIATLREIEGITVVLLQWIQWGADPVVGWTHGNNLVAFDAQGNCLWTVHCGQGVARPLLLTAFMDGEDGLRLHEAHGWWVRVDARSGCVVACDWIG